MLQCAPERAQGSQRDCDAMGRQRIAHARCEFSKFIRSLQPADIDLETYGSRRFAPRVAMMKPSDTRQANDLRSGRGTILNTSASWRISEAALQPVSSQNSSATSN